MSFKITFDRGFTLIEILISIGLISLIMAIAYPIFNSMIAFGQREGTVARLQVIADTLRAEYRSSAMLVDNATPGGVQFCVAGGCIVGSPTTKTPPSAESDTVADGAKSAKTLNLIAMRQGIPANRLEVDGFHKYFRYFVSKPLTGVYGGPNGIALHYRVIGVVSSSGKNALAPGTAFDSATGQLTLRGGDQGITVSGLRIQSEMYRKAFAQLREIASAYGVFFTSRYLSSSSRNPSMDYFSAADPNNALNAAMFESGNPVCNSAKLNCGWSHSGTAYPGQFGTPITNAALSFRDCQPATVLGGFMVSLGLSVHSATTPWGYPVVVCNGPDATGQSGQGVRNPSNSNAAMQSPPYTAVVAAWAPGGVALQVPVIGQY